MTLQPGRSLAHYRLVEKVGEGGMGEVWKAADATLGREVAVKVLPAAFSADAERLARFEREAKLLASLNHPNIATIHGLHEADGLRFLVMELVPGEDLSQRIEHGAVPVDETIAIARQIADALDTAHERGVVHRDLKPANVKITPGGTVKVLDFGLAKAMDAGPTAASGGSSAHSPTVTSLGTVAGMILGTAAYMSPEQARGKTVDQRADLWAWGVIVFEMLTGKRMFDGETISDTLASVLKTDPDWSLLPSATPPGLRRLLARCLAKDPRKRLRSAGDAVLELDAVGSEPAAAPSAKPSRVAWGVAAALGIAVVALIVRSALAPKPPSPRNTHMEISFPATARAAVMGGPALSPDGRTIVYSMVERSGARHLWLRRLDGFAAEPVPGTDGAIYPFWSPDGRSIGYFAGGAMRRFDLAGKSSQTICECAPWARGGSWSKDGTILFAPHTNSAIQRIAAAGGTPVPVTEIDPKVADASHRFPVWLPDGKHFLFTYFSNNAGVTKTIGGIYAGSIAKGEPIRRVVPDTSSVVYVDAGYILFVRAGKLTAMAFDAKKLEVSGEAIPIDDAVLYGANTGAAAASASALGDIGYGIGTAEPPAEIVWMDRQGHVTQSTGQTAVFNSMSVAPDGTRFAVVRYDGGNAGQIWIGDFARGALVPLTRGANDSYDPVWSPDGETIAFANRDSGDEDLFIQSVRETTPRQLVESGAEHDSEITDWSADGRYVFFTARPKSGAAHDAVCAVDLVEKKSRTLLQDQFDMNQGRLSPDGRWLAYTSEESGTPQIYVRPFPALDRKWLVSTASGSDARWRRDGRELTYVARVPEGERLMAVELSPGATGPNPSLPRELFAVDPSIVGLVPVGDHTRILALRQVNDTVRNGVRVILDWSSNLTDRPQ